MTLTAAVEGVGGGGADGGERFQLLPAGGRNYRGAVSPREPEVENTCPAGWSSALPKASCCSQMIGLACLFFFLFLSPLVLILYRFCPLSSSNLFAETSLLSCHKTKEMHVIGRMI